MDKKITDNGSGVKNNERKKDISKKFNFYYHRGKPTADSKIDILKPIEVDASKQYMINSRTKKDYVEIEKSMELEKKIGTIKERIAKLGERLGLDLGDRLADDIDIHLLTDKEYKKKFKEKENCTDGKALPKEVFVNVDRNGEIVGQKYLENNIQHELLHDASKKKCFAEKNGNGIVVYYPVLGYDYSDSQNEKSNFTYFNEGLTELTNKQLYLENNLVSPGTSYFQEVIFVTELIKDISKKTDRPYNDILAQFQIGMFEGKRSYLKVIEDLYGKEAMFILRKMKNNRDDVMNVAKVFELESAVQKIMEYEKNGKAEINIGEHAYMAQE